ncbi:MAG: cupin domain-containing protein [Pseudomonadota bacterium]
MSKWLSMISCSSILALGFGGTLAAGHMESRTVEQILDSYVQDFRNDRFAADPMQFGIRIAEQGEWHVIVAGQEDDDGWQVLLRDGPSPTPTWGYRMDEKTLRMIDSGEWNALTARGKAFSSDKAPMELFDMEGYKRTPEAYRAINPFSFHFWTRGFPELIPFGADLTRTLHGSPAVGLYYETGLRTIYSRIDPGGRVRDDPREMAMPFLIMIAVIEGVAEGEVDGERVTVPAGNVVFVPPHATHLWWNDTDEPAAALLIMFGDGA